MTTLQSTPDQKRLAQKLYDKRREDRELASRPIIGHSDRRRKLEGRGVLPRLTDEEITAAVEAYKRQEELASPSPERLRKGDVKRQVVPGEGVRYRPKQDVVKKYSQKWRPEAEIAFMQLVEDAEAGEVKNVTMNYHGSGAGSAGDRMGGLGNAHATKIAALNRFREVMESLPPRLQSLCRWLVLGECLSDGRAPTLEDVGRYLFGHIRDKRSCEMLALGALIATGDFLVAAYLRYNVGNRFVETRAITREINP